MRPIESGALAQAHRRGWLLAHSIEAASKAGVIKRRGLDHVVLDTIVQPKGIAHPADSRLLNRAREQLVAAAQSAGVPGEVFTAPSAARARHRTPATASAIVRNGRVEACCPTVANPERDDLLNPNSNRSGIRQWGTALHSAFALEFNA